MVEHVPRFLSPERFPLAPPLIYGSSSAVGNTHSTNEDGTLIIEKHHTFFIFDGLSSHNGLQGMTLAQGEILKRYTEQDKYIWDPHSMLVEDLPILAHQAQRTRRTEFTGVLGAVVTPVEWNGIFVRRVSLMGYYDCRAFIFNPQTGVRNVIYQPGRAYGSEQTNDPRSKAIPVETVLMPGELLILATDGACVAEKGQDERTSIENRIQEFITVNGPEDCSLNELAHHLVVTSQTTASMNDETGGYVDDGTAIVIR